MKSRRLRPRYLVTLILALALSVGTLLALSGCGSTDEGKTSGKVSTYTHHDFGFSFKYPADWKVQEGSSAEVTSGSASAGGAGVYDPEGAAIGGYSVNLAQVSVYKLAVTVDKTMMDAIKAEIERLLADLESQDSSWQRLEELTEVQVGDLPGYKTGYEFSYEGTPTKTTFYFLFSGDTQYQLTFQAVSKDWNKYQDKFKLVLESFTPPQSAR